MLFLCLIFFVTFSFQPAARKGADKSGPGAGFTVLSEKTLFLGQKVSFWQKEIFRIQVVNEFRARQAIFHLVIVSLLREV